jgi:hypothetical protein
MSVTVKNISDDDIRTLKVPGPDGHAEAAIRLEVHDSSGSLLQRIDGPRVIMNGTEHYSPRVD